MTPTPPDPDDVTVGVLSRNPVVLFALVLILPAVTAAVAAISEGETTLGIGLAVVSAIVAALTPIVRAAVTPMVDPRTDSGTPLVPAPPNAAP